MASLFEGGNRERNEYVPFWKTREFTRHALGAVASEGKKKDPVRPGRILGTV
jgi:hypothetical protein